jgi:hypothetical protein
VYDSETEESRSRFHPGSRLCKVVDLLELDESQESNFDDIEPGHDPDIDKQSYVMTQGEDSEKM